MAHGWQCNVNITKAHQPSTGEVFRSFNPQPKRDSKPQHIAITLMTLSTECQLPYLLLEPRALPMSFDEY